MSGMGTVIDSGFPDVAVDSTPPKKTLFSEGLALKFLPVIITGVPGGADCMFMPLSSGIGALTLKGRATLFTPLTVTETCASPILAKLGTFTVTLEEQALMTS